MHAEIAADPVPGAVVVIEPLLPQGTTRERVELRPGRALREARQSERDVALQHAGEAVAHLVARLADRDRAGNVGRAVEILRAGIEEIEVAGLKAPLGLRHRAIMHDRAVGPGAGNRREAQIAEMLAGAAEDFQPVAGGDLGELALGRLARQPSEKAGDRRAVAAMRRAGAVELDRVLAGLRQHTGIGGTVNLPAGLLQPVEDP